jgi:hypothetical protein
MTFHQPLAAAVPYVVLFCVAALASCLTAVVSCHMPEKPVTEQEALNYAKKIEVSVIQHNRTVLDSVIDEKYFAAQVLRQAKQTFNFELARKAKAEISDLHMGQEVVASTQKSGIYQLFRRYEKDGHQHLLFRFFADNGDINYHDFELIKGDRGVRAVDVFSYATGEQLSYTLTEGLVERKETADMTEEEKENARLLAEARQYLTGGNPEEAYSFYIQLPDKVRKDKRSQQLHVRIAAKMGDSAYMVAIDEYKTNFPEDPSIYLAKFATSGSHNDFAAALDALNRFDSFLPADPFLDIYRGLLYKMMNNPLQSRLALERFHARWPLNGTAVGELINNHMTAGHPDSAALLIKEAENLQNITPDQLDAIEKVYPTLRPYLK